MFFSENFKLLNLANYIDLIIYIKGIRIERKGEIKWYLYLYIKMQNKNIPPNINGLKIINKIFIVNSINTYI